MSSVAALQARIASVQAGGQAAPPVTDPPVLTSALPALAGALPLPLGVGSSLPAPGLAKIARGMVPVFDMFDGAYRDGVRADEPLLNEMLSDFNGVRALPVGQGRGPLLVKNSPIIVPPNAKFGGIAGHQGTVITRLPGYTGDTLQMGTPTTAMGSAEIEGLWFTQPGRLLFSTPASSTLSGLLTGGQAHIRVYGGQKGAIRACGGYGMPYFIAQMGGYGLKIDGLFTIGGFWDRTNPALQESIAVLGTFWDPVHKYTVCTEVINPNWTGGNISAETRTIALYNKSAAYTCQERIGPKYGWLHACGEDCILSGGFSGGFNRSNIGILPGGPSTINGSPAWVQIGLKIIGSNIDESMWAGIEALREDATYAAMNDLDIYGCKFNGQGIGAHGWDFRTGANSLSSVVNLETNNNKFAAYQGAATRLLSVDGGWVRGTRARGYNMAGFDTTKGDALDSGVAMMVNATTKNLAVDGLRAGGGANNLSDANNCQWGFADATPVSNGISQQGNSYRLIRAAPLGLTGGAVAAGGVNDTGA